MAPRKDSPYGRLATAANEDSNVASVTNSRSTHATKAESALTWAAQWHRRCKHRRHLDGIHRERICHTLRMRVPIPTLTPCVHPSVKTSASFRQSAPTLGAGSARPLRLRSEGRRGRLRVPDHARDAGQRGAVLSRGHREHQPQHTPRSWLPLWCCSIGCS